MDILLVAAAAMITTAILFVVVPVFRKIQRRRKHRLLLQLSECGSRHNLSFSSQELLHNRVLGLDGVHRKLVFLETDYRGLYEERVIDLDDVAACYVTKQFSSIQPQLPSRIALQFHFKTATPALEILFFRTGDVGGVHWQQLEQKARDWSVIITKMLTVEKLAVDRWPLAVEKMTDDG